MGVHPRSMFTQNHCSNSDQNSHANLNLMVNPPPKLQSRTDSLVAPMAMIPRSLGFFPGEGVLIQMTPAACDWLQRPCVDTRVWVYRDQRGARDVLPQERQGIGILYFICNLFFFFLDLLQICSKICNNRICLWIFFSSLFSSLGKMHHKSVHLPQLKLTCCRFYSRHRTEQFRNVWIRCVKTHGTVIRCRWKCECSLRASLFMQGTIR